MNRFYTNERPYQSMRRSYLEGYIGYCTKSGHDGLCLYSHGAQSISQKVNGEFISGIDMLEGYF